MYTLYIHTSLPNPRRDHEEFELKDTNKLP